jgi:PAS domain S-box-containing protein
MPPPQNDPDHYRLQLETVAENATLALFIMDEHQHCTYMNRAAEELTGFRAEELLGEELHEHVHHTRPDGTPYPIEECPIGQTFRQGSRESGEETFVHKDGHFYQVAFTASPVLRDGRSVGTIIEVRDVTEERRTARRTEFIAELGQALQALTDPDEAMTTAARMLGEHLGVDRCAYADLEEDEDHFVLTGNFTRGDTKSIVGRYAMSDFGAESLRLMREDLPYVVDDMMADPRVTAADRAAYEQTQIRAVISMPLHKAGRFVAGMAVHQRTPRTGCRTRWSWCAR